MVSQADVNGVLSCNRSFLFISVAGLPAGSPTVVLIVRRAVILFIGSHFSREDRHAVFFVAGGRGRHLVVDAFTLAALPTIHITFIVIVIIFLRRQYNSWLRLLYDRYRTLLSGCQRLALLLATALLGEKLSELHALQLHFALVRRLLDIVAELLGSFAGSAPR